MVFEMLGCLLYERTQGNRLSTSWEMYIGIMSRIINRNSRSCRERCPTVQPQVSTHIRPYRPDTLLPRIERQWRSKCALEHAFSLKRAVSPDPKSIAIKCELLKSQNKLFIENVPFWKPILVRTLQRWLSVWQLSDVTTTGPVSMFIKIFLLKMSPLRDESLCIACPHGNLRWASARHCGGMFRSAYNFFLCFCDSPPNFFRTSWVWKCPHYGMSLRAMPGHLTI